MHREEARSNIFCVIALASTEKRDLVLWFSHSLVIPTSLLWSAASFQNLDHSLLSSQKGKGSWCGLLILEEKTGFLPSHQLDNILIIYEVYVVLLKQYGRTNTSSEKDEKINYQGRRQKSSNQVLCDNIYCESGSLSLTHSLTHHWN